MTAKRSWMRVAALALAMLIASAPSAFAGHLLDSALQAAAEVTAARPAADRDAPVAESFVGKAARTRPAAQQSAAGQSDGGRMRARNVWALVAAGVGISLAMMVIDRTVEDSTPSTRRERRDGCTLFCS